MPGHRVRVEASKHRIETIKFVRELTGFGLADCKELVDAREWFEIEVDDDARARIGEHERRWGSKFVIESLPRPLPDTLDERLLDPRFEVRADLRYLEGLDKIAAIKLVRELTGFGLKECKELVEQQGWVLHDVPIAEAARVELRFRALPSRVEIVPRSLAFLAFDPRHVARTAQPLVRMRVTGNQLTIERGHLDAWPAPRRADAQVFEDLDAQRAAIEAQLQAWTAAGLMIEQDPMRVLERLSAREPSLEQAIRDAEDPLEPLLVYADWLASQGDPRGELGPLQQIGAEREHEAALARHTTHLFGPLAAFAARLRITWAVGMVRGVEVPGALPTMQGGTFEWLRKLLELPVMACLRELSVVGRWLDGRDPIPLVPSEVRAGLRSLSLSAPHGSLELGSLGEFVRLNALELGPSTWESAVSLPPSLRRLRLGTRAFDEALVQALSNAKLDALEELDLQLVAELYEPDSLDDSLLRLPHLLRALPVARLRRFRLELDAGTLAPPIIEALFETPWVRALERLELLAEYDTEADALFERRRAALPGVACSWRDG